MKPQSQNHDDMAERAGFINTAALACFLVVFGALSVLLPKPAYSEQEKRDLAALPNLTIETLRDGSYFKDLSLFYADTFPGRDRFVQMAGIAQEAAGIAYDGMTFHQAAEPTPTIPEEPAFTELPEEPPVQAEPSASTPALPTAPGSTEEEDTAPERAGPIIIYQNKGYQLFGGLPSMGSQYAKMVNAYRSALGEGVQLYNLVVPSAIAFGLPERHQSVTTPEHPRIKAIYEQLDPGIIAVDVYESFERHKNEYLYFGTDHHWTVYGAYLAYTDFIRAAGMEPVPIETMEKRTLGYEFYGTYYSQTQDSKLRRYPDTVDYFMIDTPYTALFYQRGSPYYGYPMPLLAEYAQGVNGYSVFLHGDFPLIKVTTNIQNGRRILITKESFGNAFAPFLVNHYEQVLIVDERYLEVGLVQLVRDHGINEVLILNNIFAAHTPYHINRLGQILYQVYTPPVVEEPSAEEIEPADDPIDPATQPAPPAEAEQPDQPAPAGEVIP
jgi:hypothetical protein